MIYTRDTWMHRMDTCKALGIEPELTETHDGVIVADIVREWGLRHSDPFRLTLYGSAGGDFGSGEYVLEVSSPGVDRPLREPRHWRRNVGRLVEVPVGDQKVTGRVVDADESGVTLEVGGDRHGYAYPELGAGRVQVEFGHVDDLDNDMDDDAEEDGE